MRWYQYNHKYFRQTATSLNQVHRIGKKKEMQDYISVGYCHQQAIIPLVPITTRFRTFTQSSNEVADGAQLFSLTNHQLILFCWSVIASPRHYYEKDFQGWVKPRLQGQLRYPPLVLVAKISCLQFVEAGHPLAHPWEPICKGGCYKWIFRDE